MPNVGNKFNITVSASLVLNYSSYQFADALQHHINNLLANSVMASGVIICCIFLPRDELLRMKQLLVDSRPYLI